MIPDSGGATPPWRERDFRIAWSAGFINDTGDWVLAVALPVFVFVETRSGTATALLFVSQVLTAAIFGPIGGSLVDRWDLKRSLVTTNLAQSLALLPLLAVSEERIWPAYIVMFLQALLTQINNPANVALIPRVVHRDQLTTANAALAASASFARLLGAPIGGLLVAWRGLGPIVVVDAISFLSVAASLHFLSADTKPLGRPNDSERSHLRTGLRSVRSHPRLAQVLSLQGAAQIAQGGFVVLFVAFVIETLDDNGSKVGLIRAAMAIGGLVGSAMIGHLARRIDPTILYSTGLFGMGLISLAVWNAPQVTVALWVYMALFGFSGLPGAALSVGLFTIVQTQSPTHVLGRVVGLLSASEAIGVAIGSITTGLLIDRLPLTLLLNTQAAIYLVTGALALLLVVPHRSQDATDSR